MTKFADTNTNALCYEFEHIVKFIRVPSFTPAAVTRGKSARFCRYSCTSYNIR